MGWHGSSACSDVQATAQKPASPDAAVAPIIAFSGNTQTAGKSHLAVNPLLQNCSADGSCTPDQRQHACCHEAAGSAKATAWASPAAAATIAAAAA